jgi:hypothetical protein
MGNWLRGLLFVLALGSSLGSCTCHRDLPEPPQAEKRAPGFQAALPTRRGPDRPGGEVLVARATPRETPPTVSLPAETPTAGLTDLPEDFPEDIPIFKDAKPFAVQELAGNAKNVILQVNADAPEVFTYYKSNMETQGWNVTQEYAQKHQSFLSFKKGQMITNMTIAKDPRTGKQLIAIMYYEEQPLPFPEF